MVIQRAQAANLSTHTLEPSRRFNYLCYDDDDDYDYKESTLSLKEINSRIPPSIVITTSPPILPTEDPEVSLIIGNEKLNTILGKDSNEFINSSVEDLIPIPCESEDTSGSDMECILPLCDNFSPMYIPEEKAVTFLTLFLIQMSISPLVVTSRYPMRTFQKTMLKFIRTLFSNLMT
nr:hypothetical protein [Tanacetum cinerariifolium]